MRSISILSRCQIIALVAVLRSRSTTPFRTLSSEDICSGPSYVTTLSYTSTNALPSHLADYILFPKTPPLIVFCNLFTFVRLLTVVILGVHCTFITQLLSDLGIVNFCSIHILSLLPNMMRDLKSVILICSCLISMSHFPEGSLFSIRSRFDATIATLCLA